MILEKELNVLHLDLQGEATMHHPKNSLSIGHLKVHPHSDPLPPTRPKILRVPLFWGDIFFQATTPSIFNHSHSSTCLLIHPPIHSLAPKASDINRFTLLMLILCVNEDGQC